MQNPAGQDTAELERITLAKVARRVIPLMFLLYIFEPVST